MNVLCNKYSIWRQNKVSVNLAIIKSPKKSFYIKETSPISPNKNVIYFYNRFFTIYLYNSLFLTFIFLIKNR